MGDEKCPYSSSYINKYYHGIYSNFLYRKIVMINGMEKCVRMLKPCV